MCLKYETLKLSLYTYLHQVLLRIPLYMLLIYSLYIKETLKMSCKAYTEEALTMVPHICLHRVYMDFCL